MKRTTRKSSDDSNLNTPSTKKIRLGNDSDSESEGYFSNSSVYEGSTVSQQNLTRYLVTLEDDAASVFSFCSTLQDCSNIEQLSDSSHDTIEYSIELNDLQQYGPSIDYDSSDDDITTESTVAEIRYLIELNEQGLKVDFNLKNVDEFQFMEHLQPTPVESPLGKTDHLISDFNSISSKSPGDYLSKFNL
ncbi:hypothetical protein QAD02_017292 [Eretmocerus hayati]|uniref:Uncharacterized protein n=1 Tax=Eretmocerus hayati TaxID=131215 RepID=A0ACC2PDJ8_9HYME|nr:hypothetical protein QAD02_017292 [Eretmocerus hayati]